MICHIILTVVSCLLDPAARPTPAQAAAILAQAPGISNRSHVYTLTVEEQRRPRFVLVPSTPAAKPIETRESEQSRANRMGIPGGWTPLEYAILNSGR